MLSSRISRSELSSQGPAASIPWAIASRGSSGNMRVGRHLLVNEAGIGRVAVERVDQVIAIRPGIGPDPILVVPVRLGEMHQVHPVTSPALAIMRTGEQSVDEPFVSVRRLIREELGDFLASGRQAEQIKREPADQGAAVRFGGWLEMLFLEPGEDERIDRVPGPVRHRRINERDACIHDWFERPPIAAAGWLAGGAGFVCGALAGIRRTHDDPLAEVGDNRRRQLGLGRHRLDAIGGGDRLIKQAGLQVAGHNRGPGRTRPRESRPGYRP